MSEKKKNTPQRGRIDHSGHTRTQNSKNNPDRLSPAIIKLLIVLALVLAVVATWNHRIDLSCANMTQCARDSMSMCGSGEGFPSTINGSHAYSIDCIAGNAVALLSDTSLTIYDDSANEVAVRAHFMSDPAMKISGRYAALVDLGSTDYRIEAAAETILIGNSERPLVSCAVSRNCCFALVMQGSSRGESWLSSVEVLDREGSSLHRWHCADWYITDAALSADGKYLAMCGVNASEGDLVSAIIIQQVGSSEQVAEYVQDNNLYLWLEYNNDGTLFGVGSTTLTVITDSGTKRENIAHGGDLTAFDVCYDGGVALCIDDEVGTDLTVYDARGRERFTAPVGHSVQSVSLSDEACAALGDGTMTALRLDGTLIGSCDANATTGGLLLINRHAYTVDGMRVSSWDWN